MESLRHKSLILNMAGQALRKQGQRSCQKNIKAEVSSGLHEINILFDRKLVVNVFHREIANEFFRRII